MDGELNDYELQEFQTEVFKAELQKKHITALKEVLRQECDEQDEAQSRTGVNFIAFKALQRLLITKMKQQTCWTILRFFHYDDKLRIRESVIREDSLRDEELEGCKNVELAKDAIVYLERLFNAYKNRGTQKLEESGMDRIFATKEEGIPWRVRMETVYDSGVTFDGWLALWQKYLSHRPREAYESLLYIGYCGKMRDAVTVYPYKLTDALKQSKRRRVFNIYLVGLHGTEAIMGAFVRNQGEARDFMGPRPSVVNYLSEVGKYLIVSIIH